MELGDFEGKQFGDSGTGGICGRRWVAKLRSAAPPPGRARLGRNSFCCSFKHSAFNRASKASRRSIPRTCSIRRRAECSSGPRVCRFPMRSILLAALRICAIYVARAIGRVSALKKPNAARRVSGIAGNPACKPERAQLAFNSRVAHTATGGNFEIFRAVGQTQPYRRPILALAVTIGRPTGLAELAQKRRRIPRAR